MPSRKRNRANSVGGLLPDKKPRSTTSKDKQQSADSIGDAINSVIAFSQQSSANSDIGDGSNAGGDELMATVRLLSDTVARQQQQITRLEQRVSFLLSFVGVPDVDESLTGSSMSTSAVHVVHGSAGHRTGAELVSAGETSVSTVVVDGFAAGGAGGGGSGDTGSFEAVVGRRRRAKNGDPSRTLDEAVLAAVCNHQIELERLSKSLIISGLPTHLSRPDMEVFIDICQGELGLTPDIKSCRRVGQKRDDRPQPLLVVLGGSDQAYQLLSGAKFLRRSSNPVVRDNIYINRNMTRAESRAAYDDRCRRRQAAAGRDIRRHHQSTGSLPLSSLLSAAAAAVPAVAVDRSAGAVTNVTAVVHATADQQNVQPASATVAAPAAAAAAAATVSSDAVNQTGRRAC